MKRPGTGCCTSTPQADESIQLLGGLWSGPVTFTRDQKAALDRLYGFTREKAHEKPPPPPPLAAGASWEEERKYKNAVDAHKRWKDPRPMMQAGADRNMFREATCDGMRLIACLAKYVEPGEDPVKVLIRMMADVGLDVDCADLAWANDEEEAASGEIEAAE